MGSSFWSRFLVTLVFLILSLLFWESLISWRRYEVETGALGGFRREGQEICPLEPGATACSGRLLDAERLRGARYVVMTPLAPLASLTGSESRCRLVGLFMASEEDPDQVVLIPWGGGADPLAEFLRMTRLLTENLFPRVEVRSYDFLFSAKDLTAPLVLRFEGKNLVLAPGS